MTYFTIYFYLNPSNLIKEYPHWLKIIKNNINYAILKGNVHLKEVVLARRELQVLTWNCYQYDFSEVWKDIHSITDILWINKKANELVMLNMRELLNLVDCFHGTMLHVHNLLPNFFTYYSQHGVGTTARNFLITCGLCVFEGGTWFVYPPRYIYLYLFSWGISLLKGNSPNGGVRRFSRTELSNAKTKDSLSARHGNPKSP